MEMEIERKFLVKEIPENLESFPHTLIEQGYLCTNPVVRVRRDGDTYYMTYKGSGKMVRTEYNLPLNAEAYAHLAAKADGYRITKTRYRIPLDHTNQNSRKASCRPATDPSSYAGFIAELDVFTAPGTFVMVEVEFESEEQANTFMPPEWFGEDVTFQREYHNSYMSRFGIPTT